MTELQTRLAQLADRDYAAFQAKLIPTLSPQKILGVRVPVLRAFAKEFSKQSACSAFLQTLPHEFYDENMLHSILLNQCKDWRDCVEKLELFLPYIDNWAVCDTLRPRCFANHQDEILPYVLNWVESEQPYTCRFGLDMLMTYYLDEHFSPLFPEKTAALRSEEYYVRMMIAWYFATALAKQWDAVIPYLEQHRLDDWTHRKAIQKARESYRLTPEQKNYLLTLK